MKQISKYISILVAFILSTNTNAQTPYDQYTKPTKIKPMLELENHIAFRAFNLDSTNKISYIEFDEKTNYLYCYSKNEELVKMVKVDPKSVKWLSTDPLASKYPSHSPYNFCLNNPIRFIDPDGREVKNGMQGDLDQAKQRADNAQKSVSSLGNDASKKDSRIANRELNRANRNLNSVQGLYNQAQNAIDLVRTTDPAYFNKINTLQDKGGNEVNVYVTATSNYGRVNNSNQLKKGETTLYFNTLNGQPYVENGLNNEQYVKFYTTPSATEVGFTVTLFPSATQSTIANEFGNIEFSTNNSIIDATEAVKGVPYELKQGEIYSFQVQAQFETKLKLINASQMKTR